MLQSGEEIREEVSGEDMLLAQIDAFRDKAKQLQSLIAAKERKVKELEAMVRSKEERNAALQQELVKKQAEADGLVADVQTQVDRMMQTVKGNMDDLEKRIEEQVANNQEQAADQTKAMHDTLQEMTSGLDTIKGELSEKVHTENVKQYRNIQDLLKELDNSEAESQAVQANFEGVSKRVSGVTALSVINMILSGTVLVLVLLVMFL